MAVEGRYGGSWKSFERESLVFPGEEVFAEPNLLVDQLEGASSAWDQLGE